LIVLAGGSSTRFKDNKALVNLAGKPMVIHVFERASRIVDESILVISHGEDKSVFERLFARKACVVENGGNVRSPLVGMKTGLEHAKGEYAIILPCDLPLVSKEVLAFMLEVAQGGFDAVVPRWPQGFIEPLHAVYRTKPCLEAAQEALKEGKFNPASVITMLKKILYVSTVALSRFDSNLMSFFNVNTHDDLLKVKKIIAMKEPDERIHG